MIPMSTGRKNRSGRIRVWLLCGGQSPEHDVSLSSCRTCSTALAMEKFVVKPVCITRNRGLWLVPCDYIDTPASLRSTVDHYFELFSPRKQEKLATLRHSHIATMDLPSVIRHLISRPPDLIFILLHGPYGEDGTVQGLFEFLHVPYTGSGVLASAMAMDKIRCQSFLRSRNIPTPPCIPVKVIGQQPFKVGLLGSTQPIGLRRLWDMIASDITPPLIIKPSRCGSSVGMTIVETFSSFCRALKEAARFDSEILVEKFIHGKELTCGVLEKENRGALHPVSLPLTEIIPLEASFFDYESKYTPGKTDEITPARISESASAEVRRIGLEVFNLLGCRGMARVDFMLSPDGIPYVLEINTIPGMTPTSLLPQGAAAAGIGFSLLLELIIHAALH